VAKLLLIVMLAGALANALSPRSDPPLLIDAHPSSSR
jgi:hypothetical protein